MGELTVHLHGGHNRTQFDGQPGGLTPSHPQSFYCQIPRGLSPRESGNDVLIEPGGQRTYVYDLTENGRPERAAFQWYHDHRLDHTARQRLARPGGDVDRRRRARRRPAVAERASATWR